jgi:hypothetical protein
MLGFTWPEVILIAIVALVAVGPDRLWRMLKGWPGRAARYDAGVRLPAAVVAGNLIAAGLVGLTFAALESGLVSYGAALLGVLAIGAGVRVWRAGATTRG